MSATSWVGGWLRVCGVLVLGVVGTVGTPLGEIGRAQDVGAGAFARIGFDARGISMGNALVADPSADVAPYYNPAHLTSVSGQQVTASAAALAFDRQLQSLAFLSPLGPTAGVGVSVINAGVSDIDGRNADGRRTETFSTDDFAASLSFGTRFAEWLSTGVSFTVYQSDIAPDVDDVEGVGIDLGARIRVTERLHLAGAVNDLLAKYEWETSSIGGQSRTDRFPVRLRVGGSYTTENEKLKIMGELESRFQGRDREIREEVLSTSFGPQTRTRTESVQLHDVRGRLGMSARPLDSVSLRAGIDRLGTGDLDSLKPSAGFGLREDIGTLDVRISYGVALEPHVRTTMHLGTLEVFL